MCTGGPTDGKFDDGDLRGQGVRVYIVDTGIQGSHVEFGGRVVSGHTVRAAPYSRRLQKGYGATRQHSPFPRRHPSLYPFFLVVLRARRVRLMPSCQRHPPRRRLWVRWARHSRGLNRRRPRLRRCKGSDAGSGFHVLQVPMLGRTVQLRIGGRYPRKP